MSDKRNKHILINLTEDQYSQILFIADKTRRKAADVAYLLLIDSLHDEILIQVDRGCSDFAPLHFKNK